MLTPQNAPKAIVLGSLNQSRQELGAITGASLAWHFEIAGPAGDAIGTCTTLLSGSKYRSSLTHESSGGLALGYEVAFNGTVHQLRDGTGADSGVSPLVMTTNGDVRPCPLGVPPPWTLQWETVSADDDGCPSCRVRVADLEDATYWNSKTSTMTASQSPDGSIIARFPASTIDGVSYSTVASFSLMGSRWVPTAIEKRQSSDDAVVARYRFYNYQTLSGPGGTMVVPSLITIEGEEDGQDSMRDIGWISLASYDLTPLATEAFTLSLEGALCWSNDTNEFVH